jgi:hypothetical protein
VEQGRGHTTPKTKRRLHKALRNPLDPIIKRAGVLPITEDNRSTRRLDPARGHDEHEADHQHDGEALDERHVVLDISVHLHVKHVCHGEDDDEDCDVGCEWEGIGLRPEFEDAYGGGDFGGDYHYPLPMLLVMGSRTGDNEGGHTANQKLIPMAKPNAGSTNSEH